MIELYATAHPRSGQTWLLRLLSYILDASLDHEQYWGESEPAGVYNLNKSHKCEKFGKTVFVYRDPRDVTVSLWHYRTDRGTIRQTIEKMTSPEYDVDKDQYGEYLAFVRTWYKTGLADVTVSYENLQLEPMPHLRRVVYALTGR